MSAIFRNDDGEEMCQKLKNGDPFSWFFGEWFMEPNRFMEEIFSSTGPNVVCRADGEDVLQTAICFFRYIFSGYCSR